MSNRNYRRGRDKEYRVKKKLEKQGFTVLRTAGSHGFADLVAIDEVNNFVDFIQCKPRSMGEKAKERLIKEMPLEEGDFKVRLKVI